jgi:hypothetical protein
MGPFSKVTHTEQRCPQNHEVISQRNSLALPPDQQRKPDLPQLTMGKKNASIHT